MTTATLPRLTPRLSRELAQVVQTITFFERTLLYEVLQDVAESMNGGEPLDSWDDPRVSAEAREFIKSLYAEDE